MQPPPTCAGFFVIDHKLAGPSTDRDTLAQIVARVSREGLADRMVTTFRDGIPGYQRLSEPVLAGQILGVSRRNVDLFFRSVLEGRSPTHEDMATFRESAKDRATEGMPLEDLLHAYRLGGRIALHELEETALPEERPALLYGAELLMDYVDRVSSAVSQAYLDERQHLVSEEERALRTLLDALVDGDKPPIEVRGLADRLGFALRERYRPFAAAVNGAEGRRHSELAAELRVRGALALTEGVRVAGLAPDGAVPLHPAADPNLVLAIAPPLPRAALAKALDDMRLLADLGLRLGRRGVLEPDEMIPELLLASAPRAADALRRRVLAPLETLRPARATDLIDTLVAHVAEKLDRRRTAERLHVHPNTLDYRLRQILELTGLDVHDPDDLVLVVLALRGREVGFGL
jgi:hypothetical protein